MQTESMTTKEDSLVPKMMTLEERSIDDDFSRDLETLNGDHDDDDDALRNNKGDEERKQVEQLTLKETRNMRIWKVLVFTLIMVGAGLVSAGTYFFVKKVSVTQNIRSLISKVYLTDVVFLHNH